MSRTPSGTSYDVLASVELGGKPMDIERLASLEELRIEVVERILMDAIERIFSCASSRTER